LKQAFEDYGGSVGVKLDEVPLNTDPSQAVGKEQAYFCAQFETTKLLAKVRGHFPLNFGREVLCCSDVLDCEDKSDWKECAVSEDKERELTASFKKSFQSFDFTQVEDDDDLSD